MLFRSVSQWVRPGGTVLDCYMGSGTTLLAAKRLERNAVGIEIEEKYCELAIRRLEKSKETSSRRYAGLF